VITNLGKWDTWYAGVTEPELFGDAKTYKTAAAWLKPCRTIGDWGCGKGGFSTFLNPPQQYFGFDGSQTPFATEIVDLASFRFVTEGILLRHVIEHDLHWQAILKNAAASFTKRMVVVLFTPMLDPPKTMRCIGFQALDGGAEVVNLSFSADTIVDTVGSELLVDVKAVQSNTQFGAETVFRFERPR
jgi:hypothetical protein